MRLRPSSGKSIFWQALVAIALSVAITVAVCGMEFSRERQRLEGDLLLTTRAMNHSVAQELSSVLKFTQALSATLESDLLSRNLSGAHEKTVRALKWSHIVDHIVLTEESGQQVFNTVIEFGQPLPVTKNLDRIKEVFKSARPRISNLVIGTATGKPELLVDIPVMRHGKVLYVLTSALNSDGLRSILLEQRFPDEWVANIFDGNGVVVARTRDANKYVGKKVSDRLLSQLAIHDSDVYENINLDGVTTIAAYVRSGDPGFGVTIGVPKQLLMGEATASLVTTAIAISLAVFALFATWLLVNRLKLRQQSEAQLKKFIAHAPAALAMLDENGNYIAVSQRWAESVDFDDSGLVDPQADNRVAPQLPERWKEAHRRGLAGEATAKDEDSIGKGQWLRWEVQPWKMTDGSVGGVVISCEDISERKRAEEKLRKAQAQLETFIRHAPISIAMFDKDMRYLANSDRWLNEYGRGYADLIGRSHYGVHPDIPAKWKRLHQEGLAGATLHNDGEMWPHADGSQHWLRWAVLPWTDADGAIGGVIISAEDITASRQAEASRYLFSEALRQASQPILITNPDSLVSYVNPAFTQLFGYELSELTGKPITYLVPPTDVEHRRQDEISSQVQSVGTWSGELERLARDGSPIPVMANIAEIRDGLGELVGIVGGYVDLRLLREKELTVRKMAQAVEQSPESIVIANLKAEMEYVNDAFVRNTGYSREEAIGRNPRFLQSGKTPQSNYVALWDALTHGRTWQGELYNKRKDGSEYTELAIISPIRQPNGQITHYVAVKEDITDKKLSEKALKDSNERFSTVFNTSPLGIAVGLLTDGAFVDLNPSLEKILGYQRDEVLGKTGADIQLWGDNAVRATILKALRAGEVIQNHEVQFRRKDGHLIDISYSGCPIDIGGRPHFISMVSDITLQKTAQRSLETHHEQLKALVDIRTEELAATRDAAQAANLAKSTFLANMSHEIRTPMNGVLGIANLLRRTELTEKQTEYLDMVETSGKHLVSIINDILDFSKIEAGKLKLNEEDFVLADMVRDVAAIFDVEVRFKGLRFMVDMEGTPQFLHGDRMRLAQCLVNYIGNALKFTDEGSITLFCRTLEEIETGYLLRFEVRDTGIGIAPEQLGDIFEAFEQADKTTTREYGGTGLGLTITRRIAQMMNGETGVESEAGTGSTFWLTARLGKSIEKSGNVIANNESAEQAITRNFHGYRILLVEDDPINQEVARIILEDAGLIVDVADDGAKALKLCAANAYALVLMDMQMPVMDGIEATGAIRRLPSFGITPILALTANAFSEDRERCLSAGMDDFIGKPFEPETLFETVLRWLVRGRV